MTIGTLFRDGPAEKAGLLLGDTVLSIDEQQIIFKDYFFSQRKDLLNDRDRISLKVKRGSGEKTIVLKREKML